jgi:hypothetical protein
METVEKFEIADTEDLLNEAARKYVEMFIDPPKFALLSRDAYGSLVGELSKHTGAFNFPDGYISAYGPLTLVIVPGNNPPFVSGSPQVDFRQNTHKRLER